MWIVLSCDGRGVGYHKLRNIPFWLQLQLQITSDIVTEVLLICSTMHSLSDNESYLGRQPVIRWTNPLPDLAYIFVISGEKTVAKLNCTLNTQAYSVTMLIQAQVSEWVLEGGVALRLLETLIR